MNPITIIRQYSVQKSKYGKKEKIHTAEPFEALTKKYYYVKTLS
ncbi:hypothetical protein [Telluribacter sp. SYSU D00476]|nr:hypothetical protein [Telluribacter sp. SYSU D00476]